MSFGSYAPDHALSSSAMRRGDAEHELARAIGVDDGRAELARDELGHRALARRDDAADRDDDRTHERAPIGREGEREGATRGARRRARASSSSADASCARIAETLPRTVAR